MLLRDNEREATPRIGEALCAFISSDERALLPVLECAGDAFFEAEVKLRGFMGGSRER